MKSLLILILTFVAGCQTQFPGQSHTGPLPALTAQQREISGRLRVHVETLAGSIGQRNLDHPDLLETAALYLEQSVRDLGYTPSAQVYEVNGRAVRNIDFEIRGAVHPDQIVVVGAHYDAVRGCPAANDNASGVAGVLELARVLKGSHPNRTIRFVLFVNEEPPHFWTDQMGSRVYAKRCRQRKENLIAMLSIETIGYYSDEKGSQEYPFPFGLFYPDQGNFIAFVGNLDSRRLVSRCVESFRRATPFPAEGASMAQIVPGIGSSDHWSFWQEGYEAVMVTDTAPYRYPHYHEATDTPDKLDYDRAARVVEGIGRLVEELSGQ